MSLDDIYKRLEREGKLQKPKPTPLRPGLVESRSTAEVAMSDLGGLVQRMIAQEVAAAMMGLDKPADQRPLSVRAQLMFERMRKAVDGVVEHELSVLPTEPSPPRVVGTVAPTPIPSGQFEASVLQRDNRGRVLRARFDGPDNFAVMAMVKERDANGRIAKATFERVAA